MNLLPIALLIREIGHDPFKTKKLDLNSYRKSNKNNEIDIKGFFKYGAIRTYQRYIGFSKGKKTILVSTFNNYHCLRANFNNIYTRFSCRSIFI